MESKKNGRRQKKKQFDAPAFAAPFSPHKMQQNAPPYDIDKKVIDEYADLIHYGGVHLPEARRKTYEYDGTPAEQEKLLEQMALIITYGDVVLSFEGVRTDIELIKGEHAGERPLMLQYAGVANMLTKQARIVVLVEPPVRSTSSDNVFHAHEKLRDLFAREGAARLYMSEWMFPTADIDKADVRFVITGTRRLDVDNPSPPTAPAPVVIADNLYTGKL